jgi:hypothetical protein
LRHHVIISKTSTGRKENVEVFGDMRPCRLEIITDVSEELVARIFRVDYEVASHKSCVFTYSTVRTSHLSSMGNMREQKQKYFI